MKWFKDFWNERKGFYHDPLQRIIVWGLRITTALLVIVVIASLFISCQTVKYVPVETIRTDTVYKSKIERDSIHVHDSIQIKIKGDSVWVDRWRTKYVERLKIDTVYQSKTDSIPVPCPVEKPLTKWQQLCIDYGKITLGATILLIILAVILVYRKIRSKVI